MADYDLRDYGAMQADGVRMSAYTAALRATVRPDSLVLDLGSGTGILALLAARMGARRVVAVETSPLIEIGRRCAVASGLADRIEFVHADSRELVLDEPADLIVADLRGALPVLGDGAAVQLDARTRLLRPGGVMIPLRDELLAAPVNAPDEYRRVTAGWDRPELDLSPGRQAVLGEPGPFRGSGFELLAPGEVWATMDHGGGDRKLAGDARFTMERDETCHGVAAWFRTELVPGIGYTSAPDQPRTVYGQTFFPWPEPIPLRRGDQLRVGFSTHYPGATPLWVWTAHIERHGAPVASFRQPRSLPAVGSVGELRGRSASYVPAWSERRRAAAAVLQGVARGETLGLIADALHRDFPVQFPRAADALTFAAELVERTGG